MRSTASGGTPSDPGLPAEARILYSAAEIEAVIARMAGEIGAGLGALEPVVMPILLGGMFTAVRLAAHFAFDYELDGVRLTRYGAGTAGGEPRWHWRPSLELAGRHVLLVDDVLDQGVTLEAVTHELGRMGAASVHSAVLIRKAVDPARERPAVDFVGADAPDVFLFGCGMDLGGRWRGLSALYALDSD